MTWIPNQQNMVGFVMVDATNTEVPGLAGLLSGIISKNNGAGAAMGGTFAETAGMNGWYTYQSLAAEANTPGIVKLQITAPGAVQQNLEYVVQQRNPNAIAFTYTVTDTTTGNPIEGVEVTITTDLAGNNVVWSGDTDSFGVARDDESRLPYLDPGTYYFWSQKASYSFSNPDTEIVS